MALCERLKLSNDKYYNADRWDSFKFKVRSLIFSHSVCFAENRRESILYVENKINDSSIYTESRNKFESDLTQLLQYRIEGQRIGAEAAVFGH